MSYKELPLLIVKNHWKELIVNVYTTVRPTVEEQVENTESSVDDLSLRALDYVVEKFLEDGDKKEKEAKLIEVAKKKSV